MWGFLTFLVGVLYGALSTRRLSTILECRVKREVSPPARGGRRHRSRR